MMCGHHLGTLFPSVKEENGDFAVFTQELQPVQNNRCICSTKFLADAHDAHLEHV